ncbi:hypothetical protein [Bacteroides heparinolyticus]|uniref:hypothetical protein n=1 Tax=Prevotella heparinolytica TaxID=28113 RepID=UPI0035A06B1C
MTLFRFVNHHVPYIILRNIIVIDNHDMTNHSSIRIDPERLTLVSVNIRHSG